MFTCLARIEQKQAEQDTRLRNIESILFEKYRTSEEGAANNIARYEMPTSPEELEERLHLGEELVSNQLIS